MSSEARRSDVHEEAIRSQHKRPACLTCGLCGMWLVEDPSPFNECTYSTYVDLIRLTCRDETGAAPGMADQEPEKATVEAVETIERAEGRATATRGPSKVRSQTRSLPKILPAGVRGLITQEEESLLH